MDRLITYQKKKKKKENYDWKNIEKRIDPIPIVFEANKFRDLGRIGNRDRLPRCGAREGRLIFLILSYEAIEWLVAPARIF